MIYTKRFIYCLSLIVSLFIFVSTNYLVYLIQANAIQFEKTQIVSECVDLEKKIEKTSNNNDIKLESKKKTSNNKIQEKKSEEINDKWRIKIPSINVDAPISEGVSDDVIAQTVGHFEESSTWKGNVALAAHNRGYECNYFQEIKNLKKGDTIIYITQKGTKKYKVETNVVIKETDWSYIKNTKDNRITLITCEENRREYRRCIQGLEI